MSHISPFMHGNSQFQAGSPHLSTLLSCPASSLFFSRLHQPPRCPSSTQRTTPAGTTPPYGAHGASHPQCRLGDLPAFELWQVQQEGRVLFYPQALGPRLWWRALHQSLIMRCTGSPVISSVFTPLYDQ